MVHLLPFYSCLIFSELVYHRKSIHSSSVDKIFKTSNMIYIRVYFSISISAFLLFGCNDDRNEISIVDFTTTESSNSYREILLFETSSNGQIKFDTLSKLYINFDNDSIEMYSGKFLDYGVTKTANKNQVYWSIIYSVGQKKSNTLKYKKLKLSDSFGVINGKNRIHSTAVITNTPLNPKLIFENLIDREDELYFLNSWLIDKNKIGSNDVLNLIQIYNNQYYGTRVKISSTRD